MAAGSHSMSHAQEEHQQEKEDLLAALRESQRQLKLKQLLLENFVPPREVMKVGGGSAFVRRFSSRCRSVADPGCGVVCALSTQLEARAQYSEREDQWVMAALEYAGNRVNPRRPMSAANARRPESEYARQRAAHTGNPRFKADNVAQLELDMPDRTVQNYEGAAMSHRVQQAINAALEGENDEVRSLPVLFAWWRVCARLSCNPCLSQVTLAAPENLPNFPADNPYMKPGSDHEVCVGVHVSVCVLESHRTHALCSQRRPRSGSRKKTHRSSKRPGTARYAHPVFLSVVAKTCSNEHHPHCVVSCFVLPPTAASVAANLIATCRCRYVSLQCGCGCVWAMCVWLCVTVSVRTPLPPPLTVCWSQWCSWVTPTSTPLREGLLTGGSLRVDHPIITNFHRL